MNDVMLGLQVTGIGMALVFLTLIIVMFAIWLLSWIFRSNNGQSVPMVTSSDALLPPEPVVDDGALMAAAIAVAIARGQTKASADRTPRPDVSYAYEGEEIVGEVVYIAQIDSDGGGWQSQSRLSAVQ